MSAPVRGFTPPRPNLGPEPLDSVWTDWLWLFFVPVALLAVGSFWILKRRAPNGSSATSTSLPVSSVITPEVALSALATKVRLSLVERFGEVNKARTTEEIAGDLKLREALGDVEFARLVGFLSESDVVKFADRGPEDPQRLVEAWRPWVTEFVAAAGARSITKGK